MLFGVIVEASGDSSPPIVVRGSHSRSTRPRKPKTGLMRRASPGSLATPSPRCQEASARSSFYKHGQISPMPRSLRRSISPSERCAPDCIGHDNGCGN